MATYQQLANSHVAMIRTIGLIHLGIIVKIEMEKKLSPLRRLLQGAREGPKIYILSSDKLAVVVRHTHRTTTVL